MNNKTITTEGHEPSVEQKLRALYELQVVDTEIHKLKTLRGDLPNEVEDLEAEIEGVELRIKKMEEDVKNLQHLIQKKEQEKKECKEHIKKYETQQNKVKNSREFDSLNKEIEYQNLEIQLLEKKVRDFTHQISDKEGKQKEANAQLIEKKEELMHKLKDLNEIQHETQKEEEGLMEKYKQLEKIIDPRLLLAYKRIRNSVVNRLGVVAVERGACGGCHNMIPPQRQLDIRTHKKIIVCEYCGRILIDKELYEGTHS